MAPVVYKNKVIIGITGVGYGLHVDEQGKDAPLGAVVGLAKLRGRKPTGKPKGKPKIPPVGVKKKLRSKGKGLMAAIRGRKGGRRK